MLERIASCACGEVQFRALGNPILSAVCHCDDCQKGAREIEALPHSASIRDEYGGTPYLTYRNDRFDCIKGEGRLRGFKNSDAAPTTRFVATCCNSGMFLKFAPGWWTSVYRNRFASDLPRVEMRNQTKHLSSGTQLPNDVPRHRGYPITLIARLISARIAMWLER